ncbi:hypothetical protein CEUSTIGMA_g9673.t1 [Chlamydomonas eustigma]|uniref:Guanylate cyclase domain-containing protein n=1 Tax=Chlamydomonas eustigma TaxID=1157962 RepID=A0A250XGN9_9CHLO|nr:hypothetical protein CEUSTIGMA_g9673.t1 [Chlamydomonas eustigma]|eukprot:GAX82245.1 hypothetical protein CEUSTIGMA_g9673.t1 [Chlamydomonas eustigma]
MGLSGYLPNTFDALPDLHILDISENPGVIGILPHSLLSLKNLWRLDLRGTGLHADLDGAQPALPKELSFTPHFTVPPLQSTFSLDANSCPGITFSQERLHSSFLEAAYAAMQPHAAHVLADPSFTGYMGCNLETSFTRFLMAAGVNNSVSAGCESGSGLTNTEKGLMAGLIVSGALLLVLLIWLAFPLLSSWFRDPIQDVSVDKDMCFDPQRQSVVGLQLALEESKESEPMPEAWKRERTPGMSINGEPGKLEEVTLVCTDVEGSTELWEWDGEIMTEAQELHDQIMRALISRYCGHEVTTEGDSFIISFHTALDATAWALHVQFALMNAPWPEALLQHPKACIVVGKDTDGSRPGATLFRGLRIRVGINTGVPALVSRHDVTQELQYYGQVMDLAAAVAELPSGGQVFMGPGTFSRVAPQLQELGKMLPTSWWGHRQQKMQMQIQHMTLQGDGPASDGMLRRGTTELTSASPHGGSVPGKSMASAPKAGSPLQRFLRRFSSTADEGHGTTAFNIIDDRQAGAGQSPRGSRNAPSRGPSNVSNPYSQRHEPSEASDFFDIVLSSGPAPSTSPRQMRHHTTQEDPMAVAASARSVLHLSPPSRSRLASLGGVAADVVQNRSTMRVFQAASGSLAQPQAAGDSVMLQKLALPKGMSERLPSIIVKKPPTLSRASFLMENPIGWSQAVEGLEGVVNGGDMAEESVDIQGYGRHHSMPEDPIEPFVDEFEDVPLVIDMGSHWLEGIVPNRSENLPASLTGTKIIQIISRGLAGRTAHFPPIYTSKLVSPSFFDAPAASDSLLPDGNAFKNLPEGQVLPNVCIAFCSPAEMKVLQALNSELAREALSAYRGCVRLTLFACRGSYECQEKDGIFMLAFKDPAAAIEWAVVLQLALLRVQWSQELLQTQAGSEVVSQDGLLLFRGLRACVGLFHGSVTRIIPHRATGRADYFGQPVNRAARFLAAASGGQILTEREIADVVAAKWVLNEGAMMEALASIYMPLPSEIPSLSSKAPSVADSMYPNANFHRSSMRYNSTASSHAAAKSRSGRAGGSQSEGAPPIPKAASSGASSLKGHSAGNGSLAASFTRASHLSQIKNAYQPNGDSNGGVLSLSLGRLHHKVPGEYQAASPHFAAVYQPYSGSNAESSEGRTELSFNHSNLSFRGEPKNSLSKMEPHASGREDVSLRAGVSGSGDQTGALTSGWDMRHDHASGAQEVDSSWTRDSSAQRLHNLQSAVPQLPPVPELADQSISRGVSAESDAAENLIVGDGEADVLSSMANSPGILESPSSETGTQSGEDLYITRRSEAMLSTLEAFMPASSNANVLQTAELMPRSEDANRPTGSSPSSLRTTADAPHSFTGGTSSISGIRLNLNPDTSALEGQNIGGQEQVSIVHNRGGSPHDLSATFRSAGSPEAPLQNPDTFEAAFQCFKISVPPTTEDMASAQERGGVALPSQRAMTQSKSRMRRSSGPQVHVSESTALNKKCDPEEEDLKHLRPALSSPFLGRSDSLLEEMGGRMSSVTEKAKPPAFPRRPANSRMSRGSKRNMRRSSVMPEEAVLANLGWAMTPSSSIGDPVHFLGSLPRSVGDANQQLAAGSASSTDFRIFSRIKGPASKLRTFSKGSVLLQRSTSSAMFGNGSVNMMSGGEAEAVSGRLNGRRQISRMPVQLEVWEVGCFLFKGLQKQYDVVQIMPSCLSPRLSLVKSRSTDKAKMLSQSETRLHTVWVDVININSVMQAD